MTTTSTPSLFRRTRWIAIILAGVGYLSSVLSAEQFSLARFLLLTVTYGAWLGISWLGIFGRLVGRLPRWWFLALLFLACASQYLPLPSTNLNWLPLLPTITACLVTSIIPRYLGLIAAGILWLSSSLAFSLIMHRWDFNAQLILLLSYGSVVGLTVAIRELALVNSALAGSHAQLAAAHTQLQEYSARVEEISAIRERNRIARDIHDTLGHSLSLLAVQLETAVQFEARGDPGLHGELLEARRVAKACLTDVRHSVEALRPDDASAGTLQERLRWLVAEFAATSRETAITIDLDEATHSLSPDLSMTLYRCAQEALTNIRKHARATKVLLYLSTGEGPEGQVELAVLDNGQGSSAGNDGRAPGFGLLGMRERIALLDGTVRAGPEPGHGWRVAVMIPVKQRGQAEAIAQIPHGTRDER
jgi:signal transduction histidine kinase